MHPPCNPGAGWPMRRGTRPPRRGVWWPQTTRRVPRSTRRMSNGHGTSGGVGEAPGVRRGGPGVRQGAAGKKSTRGLVLAQFPSNSAAPCCVPVKAGGVDRSQKPQWVRGSPRDQRHAGSRAFGYPACPVSPSRVRKKCTGKYGFSPAAPKTMPKSLRDPIPLHWVLAVCKKNEKPHFPVVLLRTRLGDRTTFALGLGRSSRF